MNKMDVMNTARFMSFSKDEQDVVKAGVELYKHFLYVNKKQSKYAEFAQGKTYEEKEKLFTENLVKESFSRAGVSGNGFTDAVMMTNPNVKWAMFALVSEILDTVIPVTVLDSFYQFAEVRNVSWGDNMKFTVPNPDLFVVSKAANGIRKGDPQRLYNGDMVLTPTLREITIQEDFYRVIAGKVSWGDWVTRVALSMETQITVDVYNALFSTYATLPTQFKEASFTQSAFVQLAERVSGMNRGAKTVVFGTKIALGKIVPDNDYFKFQLGEEYSRTGYLANFMGVEAYALDQRIVPNSATYDFAIDNSTIYFISVGVDRPVKIGFEGQSMVLQQDQTQNADMTVNYTVQKFWETAVATSAKYGIMKVS